MRFKELIDESQYADSVSVDWNKFKAALTIIATDPNLQGVRLVDAIMFLGMIGDPTAHENDITLRQPVTFGVLNQQGMAPGKFNMAGIQGLWNVPGIMHYDKADLKEFDIILNPKFWDAAMDPNGETPELIAHEMRHRGLYILQTNPATRGKIPKAMDDIMHTNTYSFSGHEYVDSWDHFAMYSIERRGNRGSYGAGEIFPNVQARDQFRKWYYQLEQIARDYVATVKVPPGGFDAIAAELKKTAPANVDVQVTQGADGKPEPVINIVDKAVKKIKNRYLPPSSGQQTDLVANGQVKKTAPPIKYKGWTLSDN
jgi:hypothetical protein